MKSTKRTLIMSVLSMVICLAMLAGTTFAWFTDTASTGVNRIQAGNLDVDLLMDKGNGYVSIATGNGDIFNETDDAKWEPGKTKVAYLAVKNLGNLALKYNIILDFNDNELADALEFAIVDGVDSSTTYENWADLSAATTQKGNIGALLEQNGTQITAARNGRIEEKDGIDYFVLAIHMREDAGNVYKNKYIEIDVTVVATQATHEKDSFGTDYDADATFPVIDSSSFRKAIEDVVASTEITTAVLKVENDFTYADETTLTIANDKNIFIELGDNVLTINNSQSDGIVVSDGSTLTLSNGGGNGKYVFNCEASGSDALYVYNNEEGSTAVLNIEGEVEINVSAGINSPIHAYASKGNSEVNIKEGATVKMSGENTTAPAVIVDQNSTLNIEGGLFEVNVDFDSFSTGNDVVGVLLFGQNGAQNNCHVNISGGTFKVGGRNAFAMGIQVGNKNDSTKSCSVTVNGGRFELNSTENGQAYGIGAYYGNKTMIQVNKGTFVGRYVSFFTYMYYEPTLDNFKICGGSFSVNPSEHVDSKTHVVEENAGVWTVRAK